MSQHSVENEVLPSLKNSLFKVYNSILMIHDILPDFLNDFLSIFNINKGHRRRRPRRV